MWTNDIFQRTVLLFHKGRRNAVLAGSDSDGRRSQWAIASSVGGCALLNRLLVVIQQEDLNAID
jgi:hypothetical protein